MKRMMVFCLLMAVCTVWSAPVQGAYHHHDEQDAPKFLEAYPDKANTKLDDCVLCHRENTFTTNRGNEVTESSCQVCHAENILYYFLNQDCPILALRNQYNQTRNSSQAIS